MSADKAFSLLAKVLSYGPIKRTVVAYAKNRPYEHIPHTTAEYMERYWIIREGSSLSKFLGLSIRLHVIKSPDRDRALHTHPFTFRTMIIEGQYLECRAGGRWFDRKTGDSYKLGKTELHNIQSLTNNEPAVTIFMYGPRKGDWYFDTDEGLIPHATYLNQQGDK